MIQRITICAMNDYFSKLNMRHIVVISGFFSLNPITKGGAMLYSNNTSESTWSQPLMGKIGSTGNLISSHTLCSWLWHNCLGNEAKERLYVYF